MENILTIDLEDWYHICGIRNILPESHWPGLEARITGNTLRILELLSKKRARATFFVLGFVAEKNPELIARIHSAGHEIATHGYSHRRVYTMTQVAFRNDLRKACKIISDITGTEVKGYRAPEWSIRDDSLWALDILKQEGLEYDSSMAPLPIIGNPGYPRVPHKLDLPDGGLWEFPPFVVDTRVIKLPFGGGWGLRIFPYFLISAAIRQTNNNGAPALIYIHPRDFDHEIPKLQLPFIKKLVLNARIHRTETVLARLLEEFRFISVSDAISLIEGLRPGKQHIVLP